MGLSDTQSGLEPSSPGGWAEFTQALPRTPVLGSCLPCAPSLPPSAPGRSRLPSFLHPMLP